MLRERTSSASGVMIWVNFVIPYFIVICSKIELSESKLVFLQYIFRHGDRAPLTTYPGDLIPPEFWTEGYGKLTKLGKRQQYGLGKFIRHMYNDFITSNPNEVMVNSSESERCLQSALSHVASLYEPTEEFRFEEDLNWQPIPIHYSPEKEDKYLSMYSNCPLAVMEEERIYNSPPYIDFWKQLEPVLLELSKYIGYVPSPNAALSLSDAWFVAKLYNKPLPDWVELFYDKLSLQSFLTLNYFTESPLLQRLRIGSLLGKMIDDMKKKIAGEISHLKVQVYSAQYHHILLFLNAFKVYNFLPAHYCETLLLELHQLPDGSPAVRLLYLNSTTPETGVQVPNVLTLEGCREYCQLDHFVEYTRHLVPEDWERECGIIKKKKAERRDHLALEPTSNPVKSKDQS